MAAVQKGTAAKMAVQMLCKGCAKAVQRLLAIMLISGMFPTRNELRTWRSLHWLVSFFGHYRKPITLYQARKWKANSKRRQNKQVHVISLSTRIHSITHLQHNRHHCFIAIHSAIMCHTSKCSQIFIKSTHQYIRHYSDSISSCEHAMHFR